MDKTISGISIHVTRETNFSVLFFIVFTGFFNLAQAASIVNIDARVSVEFSPMVVGQTAKSYSTEVTVKNDSLASILSPIRVLITSIDQKNTSVSNADGVFDGFAFIDIDLPGGMLVAGDSTNPATIKFVRTAGNSPSGESKGKNKKPGFPSFEFSSSILGGSDLSLQAPTSTPYALSINNGIANVVFGIGVLGQLGANDFVVLRSLDGAGDTATSDDGSPASGDTVANDGNFAATLPIDTNSLVAGECLGYVAVVNFGGEEIVSASSYHLCATQFPPQIAVSNITAGNLTPIAGGGQAIADEVLIQFVAGTSEADILKLLNSINAEVVGTVLPVGLYQLRLPAALSPAEQDALIAKLQKRAIVFAVTPNGFGIPSSEPNDTDFASQNALQIVRADDVWGQSALPDPWDDSVAIGSGSSVALLDLGVDASHTDLLGQIVTPAPTVTVVVGDGNTDSDGHGTAMAGIIAAATDNATGIAGASPGVQIQSVKVATASGFTDAELVQGYQNLASPGVTASIVNASVNSVFTGPTGIPGLCGAIENAISSGTGKLIVNSAGNQNDSGNRWPGRCNDTNFDSLRAPTDVIANKARFIVVAASDCTSPPCALDSKEANSNFGHWVDLAAPGNSVNSTELGNSYSNRSGTSPASALAASAAAILDSCGVTLDNIEATLLAGPLVAAVPYPSEPGPSGTIPAGTTPRLDIYEALNSLNTAPSGLALSNSAIDELPSPSDTTAAPLNVGNLSASSSDSCDAIRYSIAGGANAGDFVINGNQLQFDTGVLLDFETSSSFNVTLRATDHFGLAASDLAVTVTLNDILEASPSVLFDVDFEVNSVGDSAPGLYGAAFNQISGGDGNLAVSVENAASVPAVPVSLPSKFARLEESAGEAPDLFFDNGMSFNSGFFQVSLDVLFETDDNYHIYIRNGSGAGLAPASQSILNIRHSGGNLSFTSHPGPSSPTISTVVAQPVGTAFNVELIFDQNTNTYDAFIDGSQVVNDAAFHTGRADDPIPFIGRVVAGFEFTDFNPMPTGFDGVMQIDNILIQHTP